MKQCVGCGNYRKNSEFYRSLLNDDGLNRYCKSCCKVNRALESVRKRDRKSKISFRQRHRAATLQVQFDAGITLVKVFKRAYGICALCSKWVQPKHASMDHAYPLSKGGTHTWDNVQLSHLKCNLRKGARV